MDTEFKDFSLNIDFDCLGNLQGIPHFDLFDTEQRAECQSRHSKSISTEGMQKYLDSHGMFLSRSCNDTRETPRASIARKKKPMSAIEREILEIEAVSRSARERVEKSKIRMKKFRLKKIHAMKQTIVRSTKRLTVPVTPNLKLNHKHGTKKYSSTSTTAMVKEDPKGAKETTFFCAKRVIFSETLGRSTIKTNTELSPDLGKQRTIAKGPFLRISLRMINRAVSKLRLNPIAPSKEPTIMTMPTRPETKPRPLPLKLTQPKEFFLTTEQRGKMHKALLEEKIRRRKEEERAAIEVKAFRAPNFSKSAVEVKPSSKELTTFEEFNLRSAARHAQSDHKFQSQLKDEEEKFNRIFKAQPIPKSTYQAETLRNDHHRAVTIPISVQLSTDARAVKRKSWNEEMVLKSQMKREAESKETERRIKEENRQIIELRRLPVQEGGMQFVAVPVLTEDPYKVQKQIKKASLTNPKSPLLRTAQRPRSGQLAKAIQML